MPALSQSEERNSDLDKETINRERVSDEVESPVLELDLALDQVKPLSEAFIKRLKNPEDQLEKKQELLEELAAAVRTRRSKNIDTAND